MQQPTVQPPHGSAGSSASRFLSGFARKVDFAELTFDRCSYAILHRLLPPQVDHLLQGQFPRLVLLRNYFQRRTQGGPKDEVEHRLIKSLGQSSAKGAVVGAMLGVFAALARNLRVHEDWDGRIFFYPRLQFFLDFFPFLFKGGIRVALLSLSAVGIAEATRCSRLAEQTSDGRRNNCSPATGPRAVLGVPLDADVAAVKRAYRKLALKFHPDKNRHLRPDQIREVEARFREIQEAYEKIAGKEEFDATNSEIFTAEFFEMTNEQLVSVAGMLQLVLMGVGIAAFVRS